MAHLIQYCKVHWSLIDWVMLPGTLLGYQTVVMNALQAHGYTKAESWCKKVGNFLSFLTDVIGGVLSKKEAPKTGG